jgi:RNA polymerase sigma factor (sigma-70 family)
MAELSTTVVEQLLRAATGGGAALSDRDLLRSFAETGDQSAFGTLFRRHAGMVLGVCRRVLPGEQDAEDACQATFLVLSRKAKSGRWQPSVANWLYLTARRVARNARMTAARRARREKSVAVPDSVQPVDRMTGRELLAALDEELDRLPPRYREPLVLCYLEGLTRDEAATRLGVLPGTLKSLLERGRKRLGDALTKRGCALGAGLLVLAATSPAGASPLRLAEGILASATGSPPAAVAKLAEGVAMNGLPKKTGMAALVLLAAGVVNLGVVALSSSATNSPTERPPAPEAQAPEIASMVGETREAKFSGRVVGPDGKPVAGARLFIPYPDRPAVDGVEELATTASDGTFRCTVKHPDSRPADFRTLFVRAPGFAFEWASLDDLRSGKPVTFHLVPDDVVVHGRVVDLEGTPVPGARVTTFIIQSTASGKMDAETVRKPSAPLRSLYLARKGAYFPACAGMPVAVTADLEGRFEIKGVGRGRILNLCVEGNRVETTGARVVTLPGFVPKPVSPAPGAKFGVMSSSAVPDPYGPEFTHVARPDAVIKGVVTDAATGKPIAGIVVRSRAERATWEPVSTRTDTDGRYRLNGVAKAAGRLVTLWPDATSPYLPASQAVRDVPGLAEATVDVRLTRGVIVNGRITDKVTGRPVDGAGVQYYPLAGNPYFTRTPGTEVYQSLLRFVETDANGSFRLAAFPGDGLITALGYLSGGAPLQFRYTQVRAAASDEPRIAKEVRPGLGDAFLSATISYVPLRNQSAYKIISPAEGTDAITIEMQFDPGRTVRGTVVDPDGKAAAGVVAYGLSVANPRPKMLRDETFSTTVPDLGGPRTVAFVDPVRKLSGVAQLSYAETDPPVVRLEKWSAVTGRVVGADGKPLAGVEVTHSVAGGDVHSGYRRVTDAVRARTGPDGRFRLDVPFAGVAFRLDFQHNCRVAEATKPLDPLKIATGQTRDLGDVAVQYQ